MQNLFIDFRLLRQLLYTSTLHLHITCAMLSQPRLSGSLRTEISANLQEFMLDLKAKNTNIRGHNYDDSLAYRRVLSLFFETTDKATLLCCEANRNDVNITLSLDYASSQCKSAKLL